MFNGIYNFAKRHRRKLFVASAVAGGAWAVSRYLCQHAENWKNNYFNYSRDLKRTEFFNKMQETCNNTIKSLHIKLKNHIMVNMNTQSILDQIRSNPKNKILLWEDLKTLTFSRMLVECIASALLVLLCRVHFAILSGYMFVDSTKKSVDNDDLMKLSTATSKVQQDYLALLDHFLNYGLFELIKEVQAAVKLEISSMSLKQKMTINDIQVCMYRISRKMFEDTSDISNQNNFLLTILLPKLSEKSDLRNDLILEKMINETLDVLDNSEVLTVFYEVLDSIFSTFLDDLSQYFEKLNTSDEIFVSNIKCLPLAKIIPIINNLMCQENQHVNNYLKIPMYSVSLNLYIRNVYEVFSYPPC